MFNVVKFRAFSWSVIVLTMEFAMRCFVVFLAVVLGPGIALGADEQAVQIAIPDTYLAADEIEVSGDWWGIYQSEDQFTLESVSVVQAPYHYYDDNSETNETGVTIDVPGERKPVVVVRGFPKAQAGPLVTRSPPSGAWRFLFPGETFEVTIKRLTVDNRYDISVTGVAEKPKTAHHVQYRNYEIRLTKGMHDRQQALLSLDAFNSLGRPRILWSGDLDRDGKPDFILDRQEIYMQTKLALYLSSAAKEGEIVGLAAEWNAHSGC